MTLVDKIIATAASLRAAEIPYAFGGALALAYATEEPRGTRDIDVNVFVSADDVARVFAGLPDGVVSSPADIAAVQRDEQVRLWWDETPVDVFFAADQFHLEAGERARRVDFLGTLINVLSAEDLAVFKVLFDRSKDWVDIETMVASGTIDLDLAVARAARLLGNDPRIARMQALGERRW